MLFMNPSTRATSVKLAANERKAIAVRALASAEPISALAARLKDEFGANRIFVRDDRKVMAHLMFGVLALTVDQLLRLLT